MTAAPINAALVKKPIGEFAGLAREGSGFAGIIAKVGKPFVNVAAFDAFRGLYLLIVR